MRTLQIGDDWPEERITGLNRYFVELARHLPCAGARVQGLVVGSSAILEQTCGEILPFARSDEQLWSRLYKSRKAAARLSRTGNIDLVVSHFALYTAFLPGALQRRPLVVHFHGPWAAESNVEGSTAQRSTLKFRLEKRVYQQARRLIVLSRSFQQELVSTYSIDEQRVKLIPGGIDTNRFNASLSRDEARCRLGWPRDRPILLAVRRQVRRMGLETLIDAMKQVIVAIPEALLLLGGTGPIADELQTRIQESGLERNVQRLGRVSEDDLPTAYRAADITVVPSQALEGFGLITLESLASGTPVLVTPIGGLPEIVSALAPQCVFADTSAESMTELIKDVLSGRQALPNDEECRAYAVENFAWSWIAEQVVKVYQEAIS